MCINWRTCSYFNKLIVRIKTKRAILVKALHLNINQHFEYCFVRGTVFSQVRHTIFPTSSSGQKLDKLNIYGIAQ